MIHEQLFTNLEIQHFVEKVVLLLENCFKI